MPRRNKKHGDVEVLLLTSRDTGRWVIPKGWPMEGMKAHAVAEREAFEEAGVRGTVQKEPFGFFHYEKKLKNGVKGHLPGAGSPSGGRRPHQEFPEREP